VAWQHSVHVYHKRREATRTGFNAELDVQELLEKSGYGVGRDRFRPGYDLLATKGKEVLYVQVKTLTENKGQAKFSYKELQMMLWESEHLDGGRFNPDHVPCLAIVLKKYYGHGRRPKRIILFFKDRAYSKRARHMDYDFTL
jgi:hypothetical protein